MFPWLMDWVMRAEQLACLRGELLAHASGRILEIGIGTGLNLPHYPEPVRGITAVDVSPGMRERARRRIDESKVVVDYRLASAEELPLPDESFDTVVSTWTLCSIPDVKRALEEIRRVLKPGGQFLFLEHGLSESPSVKKWQHRLTPIQKRVGGGCHLDRDIQRLVKTAGFHIDWLKTFYLDRAPKFAGYSYMGRAVKSGTGRAGKEKEKQDTHKEKQNTH